jgi:hypothetical protein
MAISKNMEKVEQIIRIVLGIILLALAMVVGGGSGWIIGLIGVFGIFTGVITY